MGASRGVVSGSEYLLITSASELELTKEVNESVESAAPLTEFSLTEGEVHGVQYDVPMYKDINPYSDQTPKAILEREYLIAAFSEVVPSTSAGVSVFNFLTTAASNYAFNKAIQSFLFIRWKTIEWRIILTCSPFLYGFLGWTCLPQDARRASSPALDYGWLSHHDCVISDITSQDEITITQPWNLPIEWFDMNTAFSAASIAPYVTLKEINMNSLFQWDTDAPTNLDIQIFAHMTGVELSGFINVADHPMNTHQSQSGGSIGAALFGATLMGGKIAADQTAKYFGRKAVDYAGNKAGEYVSKVASNNPILNITAVQPDNDQGTTQATVQNRPNMFGGMVVSPSMNMLGDGSQETLNYSASHSILRYLKIPSLIGYYVTNSLGPINVNAFGDPFGGATSFSCSRIRFVGQMFRMWRGTLNYTFVFISSPLNSWRVQLQFNYGNTYNTTVGDTPTRTITVRGSNTVTVSIPWNYPMTWSGTSTKNYVSSYISGYPIQIVASSVHGSAKLMTLVYESAGDDFRFSGATEAGLLKAIPSHESQMRVSDFCHNEPIAGGHENVPRFASMAETFEGLARRWSGRTSVDVLSNQPQYYNNATGFDMGTFDAISSIFSYYRGSQKFKIVFDSPFVPGTYTYVVALLDGEKPANAAGMSAIYRAMDGMASIVLGETYVLEYTIPYIALNDWQPVNSSIPWQGQTNTQYDVSIFAYSVSGAESNPPIDDLWVSAGDDFMYRYILPPPEPRYRWYDIYVPPGQPDISKGLNEMRVRLKTESKMRVTKLGPVPRPGNSALKTLSKHLEEEKSKQFSKAAALLPVCRDVSLETPSALQRLRSDKLSECDDCS